MSQTASAIPKSGTASVWFIVVGLLLLTAVPALGGTLRLVELSGSPIVTEHNARFVAAPVPVVLHIVSSLAFQGGASLQFVPRLRKGRGAWHRRAGWVLVPAGMLSAASGLWMTFTYPWPASDGIVLFALRLVVGFAMLTAIVFGVASLRRRDSHRHAAWMLRAYALGAGAGTQALLLVPVVIAMGAPGETLRAALMGLGWAVNVVVAEVVIIRMRRSRSVRPVMQGALSRR